METENPALGRTRGRLRPDADDRGLRSSVAGQESQRPAGDVLKSRPKISTVTDLISVVREPAESPPVALVEQSQQSPRDEIVQPLGERGLAHLLGDRHAALLLPAGEQDHGDATNRRMALPWPRFSSYAHRLLLRRGYRQGLGPIRIVTKVGLGLGTVNGSNESRSPTPPTLRDDRQYIRTPFDLMKMADRRSRRAARG